MERRTEQVFSAGNFLGMSSRKLMRLGQLQGFSFGNVEVFSIVSVQLL